MKRIYQIFWGLVVCSSAAAAIGSGTIAHAQVVINELVIDQRAANSGSAPNDTQFIELYNAGSTAVSIQDWTLATVSLADPTNPVNNFIDTLPFGATIPAGGYYVIGSPSVPNVNFQVPGEWPTGNYLYQLNDNSSNVVDAVAIYTYLNPQLNNATAEQIAEVSNGWWGNPISNDTGFRQSLSRFIDGRDTNANGRDFGMLPSTPGASNNLPQVGTFLIPDVDGASVGSDVLGFGASFVKPKVINPTIADVYNPRPIPASPQGGNAIVAWDPSGGGNMVASNALVNSFELYAYLDTAPLNVATTGTPGSEHTTYGIGTTDPFYSTPNPSGQMATPVIRSINGNTGLGWVYQKQDQNHLALLMLVDFGEGGNSIPSAGMWNVIETFDLTNEPSDWHRLGIDYDAATGGVVAKFNNQTINFTTDTDLVGTFYVGYREGLPGVPSTVSPAIFDMFIPSDDNADFNNDGVVDGSDFLTWQRNFGTAGTHATGDANGDGNVNGQDLAIWQTQFGTFPLTAAAVAIPEPSTAILLLLGCAAGFCRRK